MMDLDVKSFEVQNEITNPILDSKKRKKKKNNEDNKRKEERKRAPKCDILITILSPLKPSLDYHDHTT